MRAILAQVLRAVLLDVDFTLFRPGPELGLRATERAGERHGLTLDPSATTTRDSRRARLQRHPELEHDEEIWIAFTEAIVRGMGATVRGARTCAVDIVREWERHENFFLYDDALPTIAALREHGLRSGSSRTVSATWTSSRSTTSSTSTSASARCTTGT